MTAKSQKSQSLARFKAFDLSSGNIGLYLLALKPSDIFPYTKVSRIDEDAENGFQRLLDNHRVSKISNYINSGKIIPGSVILSAQESSKVSFDSEKSELSFPTEDGVFLVIDGQHRLYGSVKAEKASGSEIKIPVCILTGLNHIDEVQYFIDINGNQKGVSKTLRIELTKFLLQDDYSIDAIRLKLFDDLNTIPESPLFGRLSATRRGIGVISHVPFKEALDKVLDISLLKKLSYEKQRQLILNFLVGVYDNLEEIDQTKRLFQSNFFQAIFKVFEITTNAAGLYYRNYKDETFRKIFEVIQDLDFDMHSGSNKDALTTLVKDLTNRLEVSFTNASISDDLI
jgi:DGQHR domain-containing protein